MTLEMLFPALIVVFKKDRVFETLFQVIRVSAERPLLCKGSFQLAAVFQPCTASEAQVNVCSGEEFPPFLLFWGWVHKSAIRI